MAYSRIRIRTGTVLFSYSGGRDYDAEWFPTLELAQAEKARAKELAIEHDEWDEEAEEESPSLWIRAVGPDGPNVEGEILGAHDDEWNILEVWAFSPDNEESAEEAWESMEDAHPEAMVAWYRHPQ
jgi:hypothetical protein